MLQLVELLCSMLQPMELLSMMTHAGQSRSVFQPLEQPDKCASQTNVLHASACEAAMLRAPVSGALKDDVITECEY